MSTTTLVNIQCYYSKDWEHCNANNSWLMLHQLPIYCHPPPPPRSIIKVFLYQLSRFVQLMFAGQNKDFVTCRFWSRFCHCLEFSARDHFAVKLCWCFISLVVELKVTIRWPGFQSPLCCHCQPLPSARLVLTPAKAAMELHMHCKDCWVVLE